MDIPVDIYKQDHYSPPIHIIVLNSVRGFLISMLVRIFGLSENE